MLAAAALLCLASSPLEDSTGCPGLAAPTTQPQSVKIPSGRPGPAQSQLGYGDPVIKDARITVHFTAQTPDGTTVADTERRGMAFTFLMDQDSTEPFWHDAVRYMRAGGVRTIKVTASKAGLTLANDPLLTVTVRVVRVAPL